MSGTLRFSKINVKAFSAVLFLSETAQLHKKEPTAIVPFPNSGLLGTAFSSKIPAPSPTPTFPQRGDAERPALCQPTEPRRCRVGHGREAAPGGAAGPRSRAAAPRPALTSQRAAPPPPGGPPAEPCPPRRAPPARCRPAAEPSPPRSPLASRRPARGSAPFAARPAISRPARPSLTRGC